MCYIPKCCRSVLDPYALLALLGFLVFMFYIIYNFINNTGSGRSFSDTFGDSLSESLINIVTPIKEDREKYLRILKILFIL